MNIRYCLPIITAKMSGVSDTITRYQDDYHYFEIWLDYIEDLSETALKALIQQYNDRLVLVFRRQNLEPMAMSLEQRLHYMALASDSNTLIDLDVSSQQPELTAAKSKNTVIASYHNYKATPPDTELQTIIQSMESHQPTIYKIATTCHSPADALRLLGLQQQLISQDKKVIILGMGEHGYATRIFGTLWGNEMIFAPPTTATQSAPGQLTQSQLQVIFKELHYGRE